MTVSAMRVVTMATSHNMKQRRIFFFLLPELVSCHATFDWTTKSYRLVREMHILTLYFKNGFKGRVEPGSGPTTHTTRHLPTQSLTFNGL